MAGLIGIGSIVVASGLGLGLSMGAMWLVLNFAGEGRR